MRQSMIRWLRKGISDANTSQLGMERNYLNFCLQDGIALYPIQLFNSCRLIQFGGQLHTANEC